MPFDFATADPITETAATVARLVTDKGATVSAKRAAVAAYFDAACRSPAADWQHVACMMAAVMPKPRAAAAPAANAANAAAAANAANAAAYPGEWNAYTPGQAKGRGSLFLQGRRAYARFACGRVVVVPLLHRKSADLPDWRRAAVVAWRFHVAAGGDPDMPLFDMRDPDRDRMASAIDANEAIAEARKLDSEPAGGRLSGVSVPLPPMLGLTPMPDDDGPAAAYRATARAARLSQAAKIFAALPECDDESRAARIYGAAAALLELA